MKTSLQNPFTGGLVGYNMAAKQLQDNTLGSSINNLAQVNARRGIQDLMSQGIKPTDSRIQSLALGTSVPQQTVLANRADAADLINANRDNNETSKAIEYLKGNYDLAGKKLTNEGKMDVANVNANSKPYSTATDPITGKIVMFDKRDGKFGDTLGGETDGHIPINKNTPTIALPNGQTVYSDYNGKPITDNQGSYIVKDYSPFGEKQAKDIAEKQSTLRSIDRIEKAEDKSPNSIGSFGDNPINWLANNINDYLGISTDDNVNRNTILGESGVLSSSIRNAHESGTMTDSDFSRFKELVPSENDSQPVFDRKLKALKEGLEKYYKNQATRQGTEIPSLGGSKQDDTSRKVIKTVTSPDGSTIEIVEG